MKRLDVLLYAIVMIAKSSIVMRKKFNKVIDSLKKLGNEKDNRLEKFLLNVEEDYARTNTNWIH